MRLTYDAHDSTNDQQPVARWRGAFALCLLPCVLLTVLSGCASVVTNDINDRLLPSNFRTWSPEFSVLPFVEYDGDHVTVNNVRNNVYLSEEDFVVQRETREYKLSELETVDFFVVPFQNFEIIAHTMISFGFADGRYLAVSVEIRTERGEKYSPIAGATRQYEITYVVADEKDVVRLRTRHRDADVYLYRTVATPDKSQELFRDVMSRVNELAVKPEFYDTITNNCTTNLVRHVNRILPNRVPWSVEVMLPGFSDRYAYELGILDRTVPFHDLKRRAWINDLSEQHYDDPDYSKKIRKRLTSRGIIESADDLSLDIEIPIFDDEFIPDAKADDADAFEEDAWINDRDVLEQPAAKAGWFKRTWRTVSSAVSSGLRSERTR